MAKKTSSFDKASNDLRGKIKNAKNPLTLTITEEHVKKAVCKDGLNCVIGQAFRDLPVYGELIKFWQVGGKCTKVKVGNDILRYRTPDRLARALRDYDNTGFWHLPPGQYTLRPYIGATYRWDTKKKKEDQIGAKQDVFLGRPALPTRRVMTAKQMLSVDAD